MDRELVVRAQRGDDLAFAKIAANAYARLHALAFGVLRDPELAEDATQQAMLAAWRNLPRLRDPDRFDAWVYRLTVNACHAERRRASRWLPQLTDESKPDPTASAAFGSVADRELLDSAFRTLPIEQRVVLALHHLVGLSLADIARALGIPEGTARSRLHRGLRAMRAAIDAEDRVALDRRAFSPQQVGEPAS